MAQHLDVNRLTNTVTWLSSVFSLNILMRAVLMSSPTSHLNLSKLRFVIMRYDIIRDRSHIFTVKIFRCNHIFFIYSFSSRDSYLWNSLPFLFIPATKNLRRIKCDLNRHLVIFLKMFFYFILSHHLSQTLWHYQ